MERNHSLRELIQPNDPFLLYADSIEADGEGLFRLVCERDLEGIVAKRKDGLYVPEQSDWRKIKNPDYTQGKGRHELFRKRRDAERPLALL